VITSQHYGAFHWTLEAIRTQGSKQTTQKLIRDADLFTKSSVCQPIGSKKLNFLHAPLLFVSAIPFPWLSYRGPRNRSYSALNRRRKENS
jgi:hypothetical protein